MKRKLLVLMLSCGLTFALSAQTPVAKNGALRVENGKIVNQNGIEPQLRGLSFSWSVWQGRKYYNPAVVDWIVKDFKVSIIRLAMAVQPAHGYLMHPDSQKQMVTALADEAIKDGIYVLIDWHDHNGNKHIPQAKAFFAEMAKRYAGVPNVIYEIWNEPAHTTWDTVKNYALQVIPEIRKYDATNLVVVGSPHWDQDVDTVANSPITGFKNIAYSFHFYASDPNHQDKLRAKADKALQKGLPLIVTEWGIAESTGNGRFDKDETKTWLDWTEAHHLSWVNWNITDKKETTALLLPGAPVTGGWTDDQLTPDGLYIRDVLRRLNK
ncbi:MAG: glycoside hydrolase family 5 protein [Bacteroidetes bacterium]|nr:glycoside hydrolase family 5 protein [Bacteroidota bacterium]